MTNTTKFWHGPRARRRALVSRIAFAELAESPDISVALSAFPGHRKQPGTCPVARWLWAQLGSQPRWSILMGGEYVLVYTPAQRIKVSVPARIQEWIVRFDCGEIPELIVPESVGVAA